MSGVADPLRELREINARLDRELTADRREAPQQDNPVRLPRDKTEEYDMRDRPPAASPVLPPASALPHLPCSSASLYFAGRPHISYSYSPLNSLHTLRFDAQGIGALISINDALSARRLLDDLEQVARALRRRLDFPEDA